MATRSFYDEGITIRGFILLVDISLTTEFPACLRASLVIMTLHKNIDTSDSMRVVGIDIPS